jgi:hypothetical protein
MTQPDPIFAAISAHRKCAADFDRVADITDEVVYAGRTPAQQKEAATIWEVAELNASLALVALCQRRAETIGGLQAQVDYLNDYDCLSEVDPQIGLPVMRIFLRGLSASVRALATVEQSIRGSQRCFFAKSQTRTRPR